jgi:uncharacterized protein (TIRG00374 family)
VSQQSWTTRLQLYGGIAFGIGLLGWFLWSIDFRELWTVLGRVQWGWILLSCGALLVHYVLHGWRWKILLHHVDPGLNFRTWWRATTILWAFNTLLPLRAGNLLRPAVVSLERDVPYTTLLFTMVAETVCDVFAMVGLVLLTLRLLPDELLESGPLVRLKVYGSWAAVAALVALGVIVLLSTRRARAVVEAMMAPLPSSRVRERMLLVFDQLVEGMAAVGEPLRLLQALGVTVLVWSAWLVGIASTLEAFHLEIPLVGAMFIETALSIAMLVPQAPGFLGLFQVVTEEALGLFGAPATEAKAVALIFWTVCFVPITILGLWDGWRLGIGLSSSSRKDTFEDLSHRTE